MNNPLELKRITIDPEVVQKNNLSMGEFLFILSYLLGFHADDVQEHMLEMGTARYELGRAVPTTLAINRARQCLDPKANVALREEEILDLANKMKALYPKGNQQPGIPWAEGPKLIAQRLENFFAKFGNYPAEKILSVTELYVAFMSRTPRMRTLKNFIYRDTPNENGMIETTSELYTWLESDSKPEDLNTSEDWNVELRD